MAGFSTPHSSLRNIFTGKGKAKTITAPKSNDSEAVTYMIRGKMMSKFFRSVSSTDLQVYFITGREKSKGNK